jgi:hypothetical protein
MKGYGTASSLQQPLRRYGALQIGAILDHRQLYGKPDLRSREANPGRIPHGLSHPLDELLDFRVPYLFGRKRASPFTKYRLASLNDLEAHG